jgi:hypothetical protein
MKRSLDFAAMNFRVGLVVSVCMLLLVAVLFYPIRGVSPFSPKVILRGQFEDVRGLKRNAPVYLAGMEVGGVQAVLFQPEGSASRLEVRVKVEDRVLHFIRRDSVMRIISQGLLGDKFIELSPGDPAKPQAQNWDLLATDTEKDMMADFAGVKERLEGVLAKADSLLAYAQSQDTTVGKLFRDPALYDSLVATLKQVRQASVHLQALEDALRHTVASPDAQQAISSTAASVRKVAEKVEVYVDKIDRVRWYFDLGMNKFEGSQYSTLADLRIEPNPDRYYAGGIEYFNLTNTSTSTDTLSYGAQLGFRVLQSPLFFWGGMKRTYFAAGLDLRLLSDSLGLEADTYQFSRPTAQLDLAAKYRFFNVFALTGGVDDLLAANNTLAGTVPRYHGGLTVTYDDQDLTTILLKIKTGL